MNKRRLILMTVLIEVVVLSSATVSYSAFAIKLKNDRTIYAESYWMEGNHVHLQFKSGVMKIRKDEIHSIKEIKGKLPDEEESPVPPTPRPGEKPSVATKEGKPLAPTFGKEEIESYKKKKKETQARLDEAKKAYHDAKDKAEREKIREKMVTITKEFYNLQKEVMEKNNGTLPKWWEEE